MAKVKKQKTFNFTELINYIKETNYQEKEYLSTNGTVSVSVRSLCRIRIDGGNTIWPSDMFEIEIEEEITEETKIDNLAEFYIDKKGKKRFAQNDDISIGRRLRECIYKPEAFYSLNDDMTMTLIWKDGEIIE